MKIYVAGSSREAHGIALYMRALRAAGLEVTFDWTESVLAALVPDAELGERARHHHARADVAGVEKCDLFWLLVPRTESKGAWIEFGFALARRPRPYVVVSGDWKGSIFTALADERHDSHDAAYDRIWHASSAGRVARTA